MIFRFVFRSDGGVTGVGMTIDDYEIQFTGVVAEQQVDLESAWFGNDVLLQWKPSPELPATHYRLYRAEDGVRFSPVSTFLGGNPIYRFTDAHPFGSTVSYRVAADLADGSVVWSNTIELTSMSDKWIESIFPNPVVSDMNIRFAQMFPESVQIKLYSATGALIFNQEFEGMQPIISPIMNAGNIPVGTYLLHIRQGSRSIVHRIQKI